jgi:hypothetical protein
MRSPTGSAIRGNLAANPRRFEFTLIGYSMNARTVTTVVVAWSVAFIAWSALAVYEISAPGGPIARSTVPASMEPTVTPVNWQGNHNQHSLTLGHG